MKVQHDGFIQFFKENAFGITLQVVGLSVVILNLWLATKLSPMAEDIQIIKSRVSAIESDTSSFVRKDEFDQVLQRLDKMSDRLDTLIAQHFK